MLVDLEHDASGSVTVTCESCSGTAPIDAASPLVTQVASFITGHPCGYARRSRTTPTTSPA